MAGIRTEKIFKKMIDLVEISYNISIKEKEKFCVNYYNNEIESKNYLLWRNAGEIIIGDIKSYDLKFSVLKLNQDYFFMLENFNDNININFLKQVDFNLGMIVYLFKKECYYPALNPSLDSNEVIDMFDIIDSEYRFHDFDDIKGIFGEIKVFKISEECPFSFEGDELEETINRILSLIVIEKYKKKRFIYFSDETLDIYKELIQLDIKYFPYENILMSLLESNQTKVFLEIYRVIEKLYPYVMINKFIREIKEKSSDNISLESKIFILEECLNSINWRHKEEESIEKLFKDSGVEESDSIKELIRSSSNNDTLKLPGWIYRLRNTIVHMSLSNNKKNVDIKKALKEDTIIKFLLEILPDLYKNCFGGL